MAEPQSNAPLRADAGAPTSGVIHVRTRLTADFTVDPVVPAAAGDIFQRSQRPGRRVKPLIIHAIWAAVTAIWTADSTDTCMAGASGWGG
ncbi:hypothetical protein OG735_19045 [Streptomyces sp. NBC_01210]|uniref:hypothetical protein n=1 Tax=Streptomyces sp. NBC_01210 TaxID=2903774 RepID=UPI002E0EFB0E|nr:hypothetical protein OG735_19045 [Streptomyces sp. NBC_01210]